MYMTQMLKGILEGTLLAIINQKEVYGYELTTLLNSSGLNVSDGSIYPLLLKMQKEKLIKGIMKPSSEGPSRKYYSLTAKGQEELQRFTSKWQTLKLGVDTLLRGENI